VASAVERRPGSIDISATNGSCRIHVAEAIVLHEGHMEEESHGEEKEEELEIENLKQVRV
jgi:hypothetical protein